MNNSEVFEEIKFKRINNFIDDTTVSIISQYFENRIVRGEWTQTPIDIYKTIPVGIHTYFSYYADPLIEVMLKLCLPMVEETVGKNLSPTYSYARIYQPGENLKPHIDRPACEYSVTVNIANKGSISPIYTQYRDKPMVEHLLNPGDAVVYKGCEVRHWRHAMGQDQLNVQFMLHYVDKYGKYANHALDERNALGLASVQ